jgi:3-deoxy-D-manno-octulosonic-acid transferase
MLWLYNIGIQLYGLIIYLLSPFSTKASLFIEGRKNIFKKIALSLDPLQKHIWFHFASLGEFEQGRTVLEKIKALYPQKRIVITFFSPSGYEVRKNYPLAEGVFYLPLDTAENAKKLIAALNPEIAIFTKYEYWYHYFKALKKNDTPLFIISGIFRAGQVYFKWYGSFNRKILSFVNHFFLQNEESRALLSSIQLENTSLSGDTRFDRVAQNAASPKTFGLVKEFCGTAPVLVAGSTWPADEKILSALIAACPDWKFIIAPHEIDADHINSIQKLLAGSVKYSGLHETKQKSQVLIIDNIGLLSSLYQYGNIAYIGGGFGAGIHNTLEAAAFGIPIIFGLKYEKFQEAKDLISLNAAISTRNEDELLDAFRSLLANKRSGDAAKSYVISKTGSTDQIINYIQQYL